MAEVIFYEKPGCINNTKQKQLLKQSGHKVIEKSLLSEDWQSKPVYLRAFFGDLPVADWFNLSAPAIKQGQILPEQLSAQQAIALMIQTPLLIRRPLMQVGRQQWVGFDEQAINLRIGFTSTQPIGDMESCPQTKASSCR